jgi:phosphatidate cytidylyltransferase
VSEGLRAHAPGIRAEPDADGAAAVAVPAGAGPGGAVAARAAADDGRGAAVSASGGPPPSGAGADPAPARRRIRAGRNLPAAIAVGLALGAVILVPLFTVKAGFVAVVSAAVAVGTFEVVRALRLAGLRPALAPLCAGAAVMPVVAYLWGPAALVGALAVTVLVALAVRAAGDPRAPGQASRTADLLDAPRDAGGNPVADPGLALGLPADIAGTIFAAVYVGFTAGFAALLTAPPDGHWRVVAFLGTVVASDVGGYTAGVLSGGRHKLAPTVSPGKSWEGFAGSAIACVVVASVVVRLALGGEIWQGVLLGLAVVCTATVGDLGESLLKRDIGIKDMGNLLPGHGGIMDRLDSLLCTAPVAWLLITAFLPPH